MRFGVFPSFNLLELRKPLGGGHVCAEGTNQPALDRRTQGERRAPRRHTPRRLRPGFQWSQPAGQPVALRERRRSVRQRAATSSTCARATTTGRGRLDRHARRNGDRRARARRDRQRPAPARAGSGCATTTLRRRTDRPSMRRAGSRNWRAPCSTVWVTTCWTHRSASCSPTGTDGSSIGSGEAGTLQSTLDRARFMTGRQWDEIHTGTNAVGTALVASSPVIVRGPNTSPTHSRVTSAASPIVDPRTGQLLGVLALVCAIEDSNVLMLPYACRVGRGSRANSSTRCHSRSVR